MNIKEMSDTLTANGCEEDAMLDPNFHEVTVWKKGESGDDSDEPTIICALHDVECSEGNEEIRLQIKNIPAFCEAMGYKKIN